ncbi:alpha-methylacyl-CoA racemase-like [Manduca sexta]|uniref:alpha-methylacyl-CoA racemase-like n=1 Tax=Manduca sexta TaxID=7130 RepID=UPI00188F5DBE|nr:alpha-methylacyl-CoA racemase-like [Manduca sexta]XP_037297830.1 alpha-methylacyl-CoA racemase-like [Manduca sexta]
MMALTGIKVLEVMGLAPGPLCGTILADFGASVTVVQKTEPFPFDVMSRGKRMISINLKSKEGVHIFKKLSASSDVVLDTFRPGVMEKLELGPEQLLKQNPRLIYARLTGYGQSGFCKNMAGHDINYVAMSGVLSLLSKNQEPPIPPINLLADFAGGSAMCVLGILLALFERTKSGKGQVLDASMTEGLSYVATWLFKSRDLPIWLGEAGTNVLDGGVPFYNTYKTNDGKFMAVGALEPQFYSNFLKGLQLCETEYSQIGDHEKCKKKFAEVFLSKTQEEWCQIFDNLDACVTPVLDFDSVDKYKYHTFRKSYNRDNDGKIVPEPAPRLSRTPGKSVGCESKSKAGQHTIEILKELGYEDNKIEEFIKKGHVYVNKKAQL